MEDKKEELLNDDDIIKAFSQCYSCSHLERCCDDNLPIHTNVSGHCINHRAER